MKNLLSCCLLKPGAKFVVTSEVKETTFPPGTTGFMSYMLKPDVDYQDVVTIKTVVIRRGKGGMNRINVNNMSVPIFNDKRMLKHDNYLPIGKRYYVHTDEIVMDEINVVKMRNMDFLGWACAKAVNLRYLSSNIAKDTAPKLWPKNSTSHVLVLASRFADYFDSDKEGTINKYAKNIDFRRELVEGIRFLEATAIKCNILHQKQIASAVLNSARFMIYTNDNYFEVVDSKQAKNTIDFYEKKIKWLNKMTINITKDK